MNENIKIEDLIFVGKVNNFNDLTFEEKMFFDEWYNGKPLVKASKYLKNQDNGLNEFRDKFIFDFVRYYLYVNEKIELPRIIAIPHVSHEGLRRNIMQSLFINNEKDNIQFFSNCVKNCYPIISEEKDYYTILVDEFEGMVCEISKFNFKITPYEQPNQ